MVILIIWSIFLERQILRILFIVFQAEQLGDYNEQLIKDYEKDVKELDKKQEELNKKNTELAKKENELSQLEVKLNGQIERTSRRYDE